MRRIHHAYDEDDLYDDYDDYYEEEEDEEAAAIMAQYAPGGRGYQVEEVAPPSEELQVQQQKPAPAPPSRSANELAEEAAKVFKIGEVIPGLSSQKIREALRAFDGDVERATAQLLDQEVASSAAKTEQGEKKSVVVRLGGSPSADKAATKTETFASTTSQQAAPKDKPKAGSSTKALNQKPVSPPTQESATGPASAPGKKKGKPVDNTAALAVADAEIGTKPSINLVVVGHVDAGKSTLMGHLLYKLKYVTQREMHKFEKESKELGKASFAYAWVMDEHEDERERGVTVEVGVKYFETENRVVTLLDAPGHRDFIPNMITGAAQGDVAILVVPGNAGEFESSFQNSGQTKEHAILVRYCGIRRLVVAVNKMDSCSWAQDRFDYVVDELKAFLLKSGFAEEDILFVPVSGLSGENLTTSVPAELAPWYKGPTLLETIDTMPPAKRPAHKPLRMVVVDVFKTILLGPLTVSGKIEAGVIREGQKVVLAPGGHVAKVKGIQRHRGKETFAAKAARAGENVDVGLQGIEETMVSTSSILCDPNHPMPSVTHFEAEIATFEGMTVPLLNGTMVSLHVQSTDVIATITKLVSVYQGDGQPPRARPRFVRKNQTATVEIRAKVPMCIETYDEYRSLSRVLLRQNGVTIAAGRVTKFL